MNLPAVNLTGVGRARTGVLGWMPLRWRITLWVLTIFAVVHVTLSLVVMLLHRQTVEREVRQDLMLAVDDLADQRLSDRPELLMIRVVQHARAAQWGPLASVVMSSDGEVITDAGPYDAQQIDRLRDEAFERTEDTRATVVEATDGGFLYATATLRSGDRLVVAAPVERLRRVLDPVVFVLVASLPIGVVATGSATWFMSGIAIRPLRQVQTFAEDLSAETIADKIELDNASPEAQELRDGLESAMQRLNEMFERQARFLANVSHELKTPISVIRTEAQVLLRGQATESDLREFARSASDEMERLGQMVESFLLLTRVRHGSGEIRAERHGANDVLMDAVEHCSAMAAQYGVRLAPHLADGDDELWIEGDLNLLRTAIANLVRNAIRFAPQDSAIDIGCQETTDTVEFTVRDHGPGVPNELVERLFERFTQADEERRRGRGTGLGLQIAQGIAELHGGDIRVENLDRGCVFCLSVPIADDGR